LSTSRCFSAWVVGLLETANNVDVAVRPQPTEGGRTVEVRADEIGVKDVAQSSEDMLDLPPLRGGKGTRHAPVPYDAANPGWDPFVKRFR
jgi:hypothetical protein